MVRAVPEGFLWVWKTPNPLENPASSARLNEGSGGKGKRTVYKLTRKAKSLEPVWIIDPPSRSDGQQRRIVKDFWS